jgi:hypothetical protein
MKTRKHKCPECKHAKVRTSIDLKTGEIIPTMAYCEYLLWKNTESPDVPNCFKCNEFEFEDEYTLTDVLIQILFQVRSKYGIEAVKLLLNHKTPLESKKSG